MTQPKDQQWDDEKSPLRCIFFFKIAAGKNEAAEFLNLESLHLLHFLNRKVKIIQNLLTHYLHESDFLWF